MTIFLIGILFVCLYFVFDNTEKKIYALPVSVFIFFYSLSFTLMNNSQIVNISFLYDKPTFNIISYIFFYLTSLSFLLAIIIARFINNSSSIVIHYSFVKLRCVYYILSFLSLLGFALNLFRVLSTSSLQLLFVSPRAYEELFGASFVINYLYFLNVIALCIYIYIYKHIKVSFALIINTSLVLISFFHGVKFTIFDTIMYPCLFLFLFDKRSRLRLLIFSFISLCLIFVVFSAFVRGGNDNNPIISLLSYIVPNYYNFTYNIEKEPHQYGDFLMLFLPDKIPNPSSFVSYGEMINGFVLNPSYNMYTSLGVLFRVLGYFGPLAYILIFVVQKYIYNLRYNSLIYMFVSVYLLFCMYFSFYFYAYTKTKNVYYVAIVLIIDCLCRKNSTRNE